LEYCNTPNCSTFIIVDGSQYIGTATAGKAQDKKGILLVK